MSEKYITLEIKIYNADERLPKLLPIKKSVRRYQPVSKPLMVLWQWKSDINRKTQPKPEWREGLFFNHNRWQINGVQGEIVILKWFYLPTIEIDGKAKEK